MERAAARALSLVAPMVTAVVPALTQITTRVPCGLRSDAHHRRGSPQTLPAPGQKYAPFAVVTVSSHVIARRILFAIDFGYDGLEETEALPSVVDRKSLSRRSVIRKLAVSRSRATLATSAVVGFSTLVLGDSAKRPRYAIATIVDSPSVQIVRRNSPLIQDSDIIGVDGMLNQRFGARERSFRVDLQKHTVRYWSEHALWIATDLFLVS
jgi:hypothetical protein